MDERIVWISDNGPEYGNVRWLGKLPDLGKEWMAGVEFDNPVGSGTGLYKDTQLFVTPLNHASLVPVIGLLKASDFDGPPEPPTRTSSVKLIDFNQDYDIEPNFRRSNSRNEDSYRTKRQTNDQHAQLHEQIERLSKARISQQADAGIIRAQRDTFERNIPIALESEDGPVKSNLFGISNQHFRKPEPPTKSSISITNSSHLSRTRELVSQEIDALSNNFSRTDLKERGQRESLPAPPWVVFQGEKNPAATLKNLLGKSRGIQGHNNSCYLDATLFAMFSTTTLFDSLLYRPPNKDDIPAYSEIQRVLREEIVRPLRENYIVSADQVMMFRTMLEQSSSVEGLTDEEKDPEEFLSLLLDQILKAEPYLKLGSGLDTFFYQLIVEKDESVVLPTVQDLFDQSFVSSAVRLREIPPCLLLQMPRHGRQYKMYSRIMPSLKLDITDVLDAVPRACGHRGKDCDNIARYECKGCLRERSGRHSARLASITYCSNCFQTKHFGKSHLTGIEDHDKTKTALSLTPAEAITRYSLKHSGSAKGKEIPRIYMDLFAILCIETSHYVCFVKCGQEPDSPWCFFDSMADRRGEQNGYNIPEVILFDEFAFWTSDNGTSYLLNHKDDKLLPERARRMICDAYLCFYQYNGLATYR